MVVIVMRLKSDAKIVCYLLLMVAVFFILTLAKLQYILQPQMSLSVFLLRAQFFKNTSYLRS